MIIVPYFTLQFYGIFLKITYITFACSQADLYVNGSLGWLCVLEAVGQGLPLKYFNLPSVSQE